jgi:hypothetical protein
MPRIHDSCYPGDYDRAPRGFPGSIVVTLSTSSVHARLAVTVDADPSVRTKAENRFPPKGRLPRHTVWNETSYPDEASRTRRRGE